MANLDMVLEKQLLTLRNREIISSGDVNVDSCRFVFDGEWEGYTKTAVFYQDRKDVQYAVLDSGNRCVIPAASMAKLRAFPPRAAPLPPTNPRLLVPTF